MTCDARLSPKSRGVKDIDARMERSRAYEQWGELTGVNFEAMVGLEKWNQYWAELEKIQEMMRKSQLLADEIKGAILTSRNVILKE
jgi:hypothetical protein